MPRLRQVKKGESNSAVVEATYSLLFGDRDPVDNPGTNTGTKGDWWTVFALCPDILEHSIGGFLLYKSPSRKLAPELRELGQARAGYVCESKFVYSQHAKSLRELGVPEEKIRAIGYWQASNTFSEVERLLLALTDCLALDKGRVPEELFNRLKELLSDEEILEFIYFTSLYIMHSIMSRALKTEFDDYEEVVAEVPGPAGQYPWSIFKKENDK